MDKSARSRSKSKSKVDGAEIIKTNGTDTSEHGSAELSDPTTKSSRSKNGDSEAKSAIEMVEEATGSKKSSKKTKLDGKQESKKDGTPKSATVDSTSPGSRKMAKDGTETKESAKEKKEKKKAKKTDDDSGTSDEDSSTTPKEKSPRAAKELVASPASDAVAGGKARSRPKSMMVTPKDLLDSMEDSGASTGKRTEKKKSAKHLSVTPKSSKTDSTGNGRTLDDEKVGTPTKGLRGPSRESSRTELDRTPSPLTSARRKSVGHVGRSTISSSSSENRGNTVPPVAVAAAVASATSTEPAPANHTISTSTTTDTTTTQAAVAGNSAPVTPTGTTDLESPTSSDGLKQAGRVASRVGDMRAMFEGKVSASSIPRPSHTTGDSSTTGAIHATASGSTSPHAQTGIESSLNDKTSPTAAAKRTLAKKSSDSSDSSGSKSAKIAIDREEYRKLKADMTHYRRGYDHWKSKYKDLEATVTTVAPGDSILVTGRSSSDLSASAAAAALAVADSEAIVELKRQTASLNQRNAELTSIMDALSLKFKLTMENVGLRLESLELQIKKLQNENAVLTEAGSRASLEISQLAQLSQLQAGSRSSLNLMDSPILTVGGLAVPSGGDSSSPRIIKRGTSQKDVGSGGKRTLSSQNFVSKPGSPVPGSPVIPSLGSSGSLAANSSTSLASPHSTGTSSSSSSASGASNTSVVAPGSIKDVSAFLSSFLIDLSTLRRKVIIPLLSQPIETLDKRTRVVVEMLDTEQKYIFGIEVMITNWEKPLVAYATAEPKIPLNELKSIFGDGWLQFMVANNAKFLCAKLEERLLEWTETSTVGDIFTDFEPYLHPYKRYCSKYEESLKMLTALAESNPKFKKALEYFDNHCFGFNGLRLRDYLITPVQRVPRYNLLLRDLLNCTPESHPDYALLTTALSRIASTATDINEGIRQAESQLKMREINERGNGFEALTRGNSYRIHIKSGPVDVLVDLLDRRRALPNKKPELIVFNDLIVSGAFVNKKAAQQEYAIPTALAWISSDLTESPEDLNPLLEGCPRQNAFLLRGPESLWLVGIRKQSDLNSFMEAFQNVIGCPVAELPNGPRRGKYDFMRLPGNYDGQWLDGEFHGSGIYVKTDGTLFDGHWDSRFKAGFGQVTASGVGQSLSGWKNLRPDQDVAIFKDHHFWETRMELTERDWAILLTGAREVQYKKDQKVIEQGFPNSSLFKIKSGKCRVEKEASDGTRSTLVTLQAGAYFGDTSVLPMMRTATADVICDTQTAEIHVIEVTILFEILKTDPALAMRFFRQLARTLANRLRSLHQTPATKAIEKKKRSESSGELPTIKAPEGDDATNNKVNVDNSYCDKFDLPPGEVIIKEMTAGLRGVIKKYGHLYLSQKFLCFEAHVFGMASKEVIPLERVSKVEIIKKKYIQVTSKKNKFEFTVDNLDELQGLLSSMCSKPASAIEEAGRLLHVEKSESDTQTASSEDSGVAHGTSSAAPGTSKSPVPGHPRRRSTHTITVADETDTGSLTKGDWNLLQQGFQCITYTKDKPITEQGTTPLRLYQIARGKCRIQIKSADSEPQVVGFLNTGALFGEISFLDSSAATASVIANEDVVEVYVIEGYFINILFVKYPELAGRFFAYIAGVIAGRLNEREATRGTQDKSKARKAKPSTAGGKSGGGGSSPTSSPSPLLSASTDAK